MVAQKFKQWLIFFRAHTGMLEAPIPAFGAAVALGSLWRVEVLAWAVVGLLYHFAGYGQNSYYDWEKGYDKDDPHKQHHPLNTGAINPERAKFAANGMVAATVLAIVMLTGFTVVPLLLLAVALLSGLLYNLYGKSVTHKYMLLAVAHSMLFVIPYTLYGNGNARFAAVVFLALVVHHCFQIAISGDVKDINQEESSLLNKIGVVWEDGADLVVSYDGTIKDGVIKHTRNVDVIVTFVTALQVAFALVALCLTELSLEPISGIVFLMLLGSISLWFVSIRIVTSGPYIRKQRMRNIAVRELIGFWIIYMAFIPIIGGMGYAIAFILCILYLFTLSKAMWGTLLRPKV